MAGDVIIDQVAEKLRYDSRILVAFSGGVDSSVLLHALVSLRHHSRPDLLVRAVYVHHGLSHYADQWAEHCQTQCKLWQIDLQIVYVQVDASVTGIEAAAREARYQAIHSLLSDDEILVTAQHQDDQCETFFLALKRGSGPAGLSAMPERMAFFDHQQVRPLLNITRAEIEHYAESNSLSWIEDDSNQDDRFDRNFLRLRVLPEISRRWPQFPQMVSRSAELCAEQEALLDELLTPVLEGMIKPDGAINISALAQVSVLQRRALLRRWFRYHQVMMPSRSQLDKIWLDVALSKPDAEPQFQLGSNQIRRYRENLYLLPSMQNIGSINLSWDGCEPLELPDNLGQLIISHDKGVAIVSPENNQCVSIRFTAPGADIIRIVGREHSRTLKKLWQELSVPPWQRQRIPLVYYGQTLIAAIGFFVTAEGSPKEERPVWRICWTDSQGNALN